MTAGQAAAILTACTCFMACSQVAAMEQPAMPQHPYLLFTAEQLPAIRASFSQPRNRPLRDQIIEKADQLLTYSGEGKFDATSPQPYKLFAQRLAPSLDHFYWAYIITGEPKYRDTLLEVLRNEWRVRANLDREQFRFEFTTSGTGEKAARVYDLLYPELSDEDRLAFGAYLDQYLTFKKKPSHGWSNNIGTTYFSAVGTIALVRLGDNPHARQVVDESIRRLKADPYRVSLTPHADGGYPEGPLYADYALLHLLPFVDAYERITGDLAHGLLDAPFFTNLPKFVQSLTGGDGVWAPVFDAQPQAYGIFWMAYLGQRFNQPLLKWMSDHYFEREMQRLKVRPEGEVDRSLPLNVLYRDWTDTQPFPGLPTVSILSSTNTGALRSDPALEPALMVIARGFGTNEPALRAPHKDVGSFLLYAGGENFLIDPGYYQPEFEAHSVLLLDGHGPTARRPSPLAGAEQGERRMLSIDPTAAYATNQFKPPAIRRTWVMVDERAVVLLDDVAAAGEVTALLQAGFEAEVEPDGGSAIITGKRGRLWLRGFGPAAKMGVEGPIDFGKSWIYKKMADAGAVAWHRIRAEYRHDPMRPMVWVFVPLTADQAAPDVVVDHQAERITVKITGAEPVIFTRTASRWLAQGLSQAESP